MLLQIRAVQITFDEEHSKLSHHTQWFENPSHMNNLNNVQRETSRHLKNGTGNVV
jgi:hypothetical protein